jgi:hypothetical protein
MRALNVVVLASVLAAVGCKAGDGLVVVTVDASPALSGIAYLHTVAHAGAKSMSYDVGRGSGPFDIPPAKTFAFDVSTVSSGSFDVDVEAHDAADNLLASGSGSVALAAGSRRDISITLGAGNGDGGADFAGCMVTVTCQSLALRCGTPDDGCGGTLDCGACQLDAVYQPIGIVGDTISLEGKFNDTTTVTFPGGQKAAATILGPNRASVTVPAQATSGDLTITSGGMTTPPLLFRRPAFALGLASFAPQYEQATYARQTPSLPTAATGTAVAATESWVYATGGFNAGALDKVERAMINADGTLGAFIPAGTLTTPSNDHGSVVLGKWLYVIGGSNGSALMRVERAAIGANGALGAFADAGVALTVPRSGATVTIVGAFVYVVGGTNAGGALPSIERAPIGGDGTLGVFADAGQTLRTARSGHTATVSGNFLYVVGGAPTASTYTDRVERAPIAGDGTIGAFVDQMPTVHMVAPRTGQQMQIIGDHVFVFGGTNGTVLTSVESAPVAADGTIGAFATTTATSGARADFASVVVGNYVYEVGGSTTVANVDRATINASSAIATFADAGAKLKVAGTGQAIVVGNYLYVLEGAMSQHAPINADGTLGAFVADPTQTAAGFPAVLGNYVYVINSSTPKRAAINDDGTLGAFAAVTVTGKTTIGGYSLLVLGDRLFSLAGTTTGSDSVATVEAAPVASDGSLTFSTTSIGQLVASRTRGAAVAIGSNAFEYLGYQVASAGTTPNSDRGAFDASFNIASFTTTGTRVSTFDPTSVVVGSELYLVASTSIGTTIYGVPFSDTTLAFAPVSGVTAVVHRRDGGALATNSYVYSFGGIDDGNSINYDTIEVAALK